MGFYCRMVHGNRRIPLASGKSISLAGYDFTKRDRKADISLMQEIAKETRLDILEMLYESKSGHLGGSLSAVELLVVLYMCRMRYDPKDPKWKDRDRFLLSKGHASPLLYSILSRFTGSPSRDELKTLRKLGSRLQGHPDPKKLDGVEIPGGPEGIGLSEAVGMALKARLGKSDSRIYVMMGDGEQDEGEVWEAAMSAVKFGLGNMTAIIDANGVQQEGSTKEIMPIEPLPDKWRAFGWNVYEIDGHDFEAIIGALDKAGKNKELPSVIVARTVKGKGVDFMEGKPKYHSPVLSDKELQDAKAQILGA